MTVQEKDLNEVVALKMQIDGLIERAANLKATTFAIWVPGIEQAGKPVKLLSEYLNLPEDDLNAVVRHAILVDIDRLINERREHLRNLGVQLQGSTKAKSLPKPAK